MRYTYFRLFFQSITEIVAWKQLWQKRGHLYLTICPIESMTPISNINCLFTTSVILNALSNVTSAASSISKSVAVRFGLTENVVKYEKNKTDETGKTYEMSKKYFCVRIIWYSKSSMLKRHSVLWLKNQLSTTVIKPLTVGLKLRTDDEHPAITKAQLWAFRAQVNYKFWNYNWEFL